MKRRTWTTMAGLAALGCGACSIGGGGSGGTAVGTTTSVPDRVIDFLKRNSPDGFGVWQRGHKLADANLGKRNPSLSLAKSVAALAAQRGIERGWLAADVAVGETFPEWRGDGAKESITLRMLVNQTGGFPSGAEQLYRYDLEDKGLTALALPLESLPGTAFHYGPASWEILEILMRRRLAARGESINGHLALLLNDIGISSPKWRTDLGAHYYLSTGPEFSVADLGRLGAVLGDLAIGSDVAGLSSAVFRDLTAPRSPNPMHSAGIWWNRRAVRAGAVRVTPEQVLRETLRSEFWNRACIEPSADPAWFAMVGSGGKRIYVLPTVGIVIVRMGRNSGWDDGGFLRKFSAGRS